MLSRMDGLQFFDRRQDFTVAWKTLPHWAQAGTVTFVTWRTADSLPRELMERLSRSREELLRRFGIDVDGDPHERSFGETPPCRQVSPKLAAQLAKLSQGDKAKLNWELFRVWDGCLDRGAGECVLARPELSEIVERSLRHFDGDRYVLTDAVVMPNHVHMLVAFADADQVLAQVAGWKRYTSRQIQQALGRRGEFWQAEQFDHLVRSLEYFEYFRQYLAENPRKAGLKEGAYRYYSKAL